MKVGLRVVSAGSQEGKILPINLSQFLIGRDKQCQLRPASPSISKRHCAIILRGDKVIVRDFDSTNGTFVNGTPVKGQVEVQHKDRLEAGPLQFEILIVGATAADQQESPDDNAVKKAESRTPADKQKAAVSESGESNKEAVTTEPAKDDPAKKEVPATAAASNEDDDEIAAMLLGMQDESSSLLDSSEEIPEGSTVMDMVMPPTPGDEAKTEEQDPSMLEKEKEKQASTSSAAKNILEKYMRRPR